MQICKMKMALKDLIYSDYYCATSLHRKKEGQIVESCSFVLSCNRKSIRHPKKQKWCNGYHPMPWDVQAQLGCPIPGFSYCRDSASSTLNWGTSCRDGSCRNRGLPSWGHIPSAGTHSEAFLSYPLFILISH
jgi:hypothetical protein